MCGVRLACTTVTSIIAIDLTADIALCHGGVYNGPRIVRLNSIDASDAEYKT